MKRYIFTQRNGIHIIDLQQTLGLLNWTCKAVTQTVAEGSDMLFVGTKKQAQDAMWAEANRCGMPYVNQRWMGGSLTNFAAINARVKYMLELEEKRERGYFGLLPRKEALRMEDTLNRLHKYYAGMRDVTSLPGALFVVDIGMEKNCIAEARRTGVAIFALVDTDCDPDVVDYPIPGNDDAIRSIKLVTGRIADAVQDGMLLREAMLSDAAEQEEAGEVEEADAERSGLESVSGQEIEEIEPTARWSGQEPEDV
jgi:small subunit ribosomal protein S2